MSNTDSSSWWQTAFEVISSSSSFISSIDSGRFTHNPVKSPSKYSAEGRKRGRMIDCSDSCSTSKSSLFDDAMMAVDECDTESADKARLFNLPTSDPADEGFLGKIKMSWESGKRFVFSSNDQKDKLTPHPSWCKMNDPSVYALKQQYLVDCLDESKSILETMIDFNKNRWCIKFPLQNKSKILNLALKTSGYEDADLIFENLDSSSIKNMVDSKLLEVCEHIDRISNRIKDTTSKILVTGDVNAGKSTFVNSLLKKSLLPTDQQPCTLAFCEVINAKNNNDVEEVHVHRMDQPYNGMDVKTFDRLELSDITESVTAEDCEQVSKAVKIYCKSDDHPSSILHNEAVDIVLIDSPGLNCDSFKTMSLYARQEDIDVVIFVINAANHLTLSAQEFLTAVAKEKSFVFIVVNRFDDIRDKERCKSKIMGQIRGILPQTFENSSDLVHFVSSRLYLESLTSGLKAEAPSNPFLESFSHLEASLSDFTLEKRTKSKLSPAKTFVANLLKDMEILSDFNLSESKREVSDCSTELSKTVPMYEDLIKRQEAFSDGVEKSIDEASERIKNNCSDVMTKYLDELELLVMEIPWHGPLDMHNYALEVVSNLNFESLERFRYCRQVSKKISETITKEMISTSSVGLSSPLTLKSSSNNHSNSPVTQAFPSITASEYSLNNNGFEFTVLDTLSSLLYVDSFPSIVGFTSAIFAFFGQYARFFSLPFRINISGRSLVISTGVFGLGGLYLLTRNLQKKLNHRICEKVRRHYEVSSSIMRQSNILIQHCQRSIRCTAWDLQKGFASAIAKHQKSIADLKTRGEIAGESESFFNELKSHVVALQENIHSVEVE